MALGSNYLRCCLLILFLIRSAVAQTVTQEQCQQADAQLNQVYKQLMGSLNDAQKQQLKTAQRQWIKQRDAFVAQNSGNPQGAFYQATINRRNDLVNIVVCDANPRQLENDLNKKVNAFKKELSTNEREIFEKDYKDILSKEKKQVSIGFTISNHIRYNGDAKRLFAINNILLRVIELYRKNKGGISKLSNIVTNNDTRIPKAIELYKNIAYQNVRFELEIPMPSEEVAKDYENYGSSLFSVGG